MSSDPKDPIETVQTTHRYVVVEGPIGVGKTSLARRLAKSFGSELVLEQGDENPFLERFYRNPRAAAFQAQLYFLFQRARQIQDLRQADLFERLGCGSLIQNFSPYRSVVTGTNFLKVRMTRLFSRSGG